MGIVIRQSLLSSIAGYLGVAIGYLNVVILMPLYLSPEEIGLYRTILSTAALFAPIPLFGLKSAFMRFFPLNQEKQNQTLVTLGLFTFILFLAILSGLAIVFKDTLSQFFVENAAVINDYFWLILVLMGLIGFHGFFESLLKAQKNIATPSFVRETLYKSLQSMAVLGVGISLITIHQFLVFQSFIYVGITLIILFFVFRSFPFRLKINRLALEETDIRSFYTYARYALLSSLGTVAVLQIDQIMISKYIGLEANAIYTTAIFMAVVIELPRRSLVQIVQPIITEDFKANRLEKINRDYKSASINQLIIGSYLFLGIVINLPNIYALMPNGTLYSAGITIVYLIGIAKLINMVFSINGEIIVMSQHYRINILLIAFLGIVTIALNLLLIPSYGIEGAGFASLLTFLAFNLIKYFYIKAKFNFSPFSKWTVPSILIIPIVLYTNSLFAYMNLPLIDILIRSITLSLIFLGYVLLAKPSKELIGLMQGLRKKLS